MYLTSQSSVEIQKVVVLKMLSCHLSRTFLFVCVAIAHIRLISVDLMQLVEEAVDGCWIGYHARTSVLSESEIGSVYSPPEVEGELISSPSSRRQVETIVDIGRRGQVRHCVVSSGFKQGLPVVRDGS
jgi:hypothetical protein